MFEICSADILIEMTRDKPVLLKILRKLDVALD